MYEEHLRIMPKTSASLVLTASCNEGPWMYWCDLKRAGLIPLFILVVILSTTVKLYLGEFALDTLSMARWSRIVGMACIFPLMSFLLDCIATIIVARNFMENGSGKVKVHALWKNVYTNPLCGIVLIIIMIFGITSAQGLSNYYRVIATTWYDANLWALEAPIFHVLKKSLIDVPIFWDYVYFAYWLYLFLVYCVLYRLRRFHDLSAIAISIILCFFFTRWVGIYYPTAGPAFFQPSMFDISGTISDEVQKWLVKYMRGEIPQDGFIPGTMAMPSLHVGVTAMAAWFLSRNVERTLWLSIPWICLTWLSTVMLGWHYILDGVGGIAVAFVAVIVARGLQTLIRVRG
jgi:membrane-associated phospholipid phosphatase